MRFILGANLLSAVLVPVLVYGAGLGLTGSAIANALAQTVSGGLFVRALLAEAVPLAPPPGLIPAQLVVAPDLVPPGAAFQGGFLSAAAVAGRVSARTLAAIQIA